jgi:hypothetical protein
MQHPNVSRRLKIALLVTVAVFWALVVADTFLPLPRVLSHLKGSTTPPPPPEWSPTALRSGATVRALTAWVDANIGLRSFWVRLDNQIDYSLFRQTAQRGDGTRLVLGAGDWLYERQYVEYATNKSILSPEECARRTERMRRVEAKLARRGIPLLYVIAPSKASVYPEHIPAEFFREKKPEQIVTSWELGRNYLPNSGVSYIDGPALYAGWKKEGVPNLFARSGTHWSYVSALRIWDEIRASLNPRLTHPIPPLQFAPLQSRRPQNNDRDLLDLANLLVSWPYEHPLPKPTMIPQKGIKTADLPRILWVHDSFGWVLIEELYESNSARPSNSLYYFATEMKIPGGVATDRKIAEIDWPTYLRDYDAIVLVWTEIAYEFDSCGFFEAIDKALD